MTLKESQGSSLSDLGRLKKGETVRGKVKRLEAFGAFVQLDNSPVTGLAHISEVSDDYVKNLRAILQVGQGELSASQSCQSSVLLSQAVISHNICGLCCVLSMV